MLYSLLLFLNKDTLNKVDIDTGMRQLKMESVYLFDVFV